MKSVFGKAVLAAAVVFFSAGVFAAPGGEGTPAPDRHGHPVMMLPPPPAPLYAVIQQTDNPGTALDNAVKNIPALENGKRYEVRVEVKEVLSNSAAERTNVKMVPKQ